MKKQKKTRGMKGMMLLLVMAMILIPVNVVRAADTYKLNCLSSKQKQVIYTKDSLTTYLNVELLKNGKIANLDKVKKSDIKWKSSDSSVVKITNTVAEYGYKDYLGKDVQTIYAEVIGLKKGKATVTASYKGTSCKFDITVKGGTIIPGFSLSKEAYVPAGSDLVIELNGDGWSQLSGDDVKFSSTNASVAKASARESGYGYVLKGLKEGKTQVSAKSKLGTLKIDVTVLPKCDLQIKNFKNVKKNGKIIGYSFDAVNKGTKTITIVQSVLGDEYSVYSGKIKGNSVIVKKGQTKTVTVIVDGWGEYDFDVAQKGNLVSEYQAGLAIKYEGKTFAMWFSRDGKKTEGELYMKKW